MADIENLPYHRKYRPNTIKKYIGNAKLKETALKALSSGKRPQVILLWGDSGCGKAQPLDSLVLTNQGYRKIGDIKVGNTVITHKGNKGKVSGIYPQGVRPIYRITLSDKTYIDVSDEHLNCVYRFNTKLNLREDFVVTTKELIEMFNKNEYSLCIDSVDLSNVKINNLSVDRNMVKSLESIYNVSMNINSRQDADNYANGLRFCGKYVIVEQNLGYCTINCSNEGIRYIESIKHIGDKECQCIMVDHPDHTYISNFMIPTHNTTFARLLAKEYSCENRDDEEGACGVCPSCQVIDDYIATGDTSILTNIQEIDITDQNGKKDLDSVLQDMELPGYDNEWKIYLFDEIHMATVGLQNRLLKIAEEPPENVLMLLCTTNPEKLLDTLKNRCQLQLHVTKPKVRELAGLLRSVCENEGVYYDQKGLEFIANRGALTIRTALQNLQQVVTEQSNAYYDSATKVFETISSTIIVDLFRALKKKDTMRYVTILCDIKSKMDLNAFLVELKGFVMRGIYTINNIPQDGVSDNELLIYRDLFSDMGVAQITYLLNKLLTLDTKNLEMELIMFGYSGLDIKNPTQEEFDKHIAEIENELQKEVDVQNKILKEKADEKYEQGVQNASNLMENVTLDDLLDFGATLVE